MTASKATSLGLFLLVSDTDVNGSLARWVRIASSIVEISDASGSFADTSVYIVDALPFTRDQWFPRFGWELLHEEEKARFMIDASSHGTDVSEDWTGEGGKVDLTSLVALASSRVDAMFLRFRLLSVLLEAPLSKVDALTLLSISRPYLDQILEDWISLKMVDVRDASPQHVMKPRMSIYLVKRPVISITRLDSDVNRIYGLSDMKELLLAIVSRTRRIILATIADGSLSVKELGEKVQRGDIYKHIRLLLKARLLLKLKAPGGQPRHRKLAVVVRRNYKNIGFSFEPYAYS